MTVTRFKDSSFLQGSSNLSYPFIVFTVFGVVGILTTSLVPETKGEPLPERNEDVESMVSRFRYWRLRPWLEREQQEEEQEEAAEEQEDEQVHLRRREGGQHQCVILHG